jgi:hypothetical protein
MAQSSLGRRTARQVGELARSLATIWASAVRASAPGLATQPTHVTARSALRRDLRLNRLRAYLYKPQISVITVDPSSTHYSNSQYKYYITRSSLPCVVVCATVYMQLQGRTAPIVIHLYHRSKPRQPVEPTRHQCNRCLQQSIARMS